MLKRSRGRKLAMQLLYSSEIRGMDMSLRWKEADIDRNYSKDIQGWALKLAAKAWTKRVSSDEIIGKYSIGWDINRLNQVDKSVLRLAFYELNYTDTPVKVVLNEAIEMAKLFSTDESPRFINGILGNFVEKECLPA